MHIRALTAVVVIAAIAAGIGSVGHAKALSQTTTNNVSNIQVAPGDTLSGIAGRNGTTYVRLFDANPQIQDPNLIYAGQTIRIPAANEQLPDRLAQAQAVTPSSASTASDADSDTTAQPAAAPATTQVPSPAPQVRTSQPAAAATTAGSGVWYEIAQCESGGNWSINTGNGFYGGLQFTLSSWRAVGGSGYPNQASSSEQITRAQMLQARQGWGAWPVCSAKLGLR